MKETLQLIKDDGWLEPYEPEIQQRFKYFQDRLDQIRSSHESLEKFALGHNQLGLNYDPKRKGWWYREWAPAAEALSLIGDFNGWDKSRHQLDRKGNGLWEIFLPDEGDFPLNHESRVKVSVSGKNGQQDKIPAYIKRTIQDPETYDFSGQVWRPEKNFHWSDKKFNLKKIGSPIIYECHPGMAQEKDGVGTFVEFADNVLPRIKSLGYNCVQFMALKEHPYYGSFGYHVSNFFAPSSRFGTPEDLKYLVNKAHEMGLAVIMDMVHSHAVKNLAEGLNEFDGSDHQYFHSGGRGYHTGWDSKLFNYGKEEVLQFLLSNIRYWLEEFHIDGFRFDGVTSMLYEHHGDHVSFDHYDKYFKEMVDWDAVCYLQLANTLAGKIKPGAITIAEDMSGMPGVCRKVEEGGIGFDYRLGMGMPDYWIKLLKHTSDENWNIHEIWDALSNRRYKEKTIAYAESHDQALVGDKTLAFWLMDKEMYWHMSADDDNIVIERGMALLKMIKLITASVGGEGYLNFIGNEFGHPEWIDFPREGNDWSYKYARRQWSLVDNPDLKYRYLNNFEGEMIRILKDYEVLDSSPAQQLNMDTENNVIIYERNNIIFIINFHVSNSIPDYAFPVPQKGDYQAILISDDKNFGGHGRVDSEAVYVAQKDNMQYQLKVYIPNRTVLVLKKVN